MEIIKWTSLLFIFGLSNIIGFLLAKKYVNREKELKEFKVDLNIIKNKIEYTKEPLKEIFTDISNNSDTSVKNIFHEVIGEIKDKSINEAWKSCIDKNIKVTNLKQEDIEIIKDLGNMLGKTDVEGQLSQIQVIEAFIDKQIKKAEEERRKNEKLYKTLGAITGTGIVILLI